MRTRIRQHWRILLAAALLLALLPGADALGLTNGNVSAQVSVNTFYVSKLGNNADGRSWATAWSELANINWAAVQPGDVILLDGGATSMTYTTSLSIGKSGVAGKPITIRLASEPGRNGKAVIFGGRSTPLPYANQKDYTYDTTARLVGIALNGQDWIVIDGMKWRGIDVHGFNKYGIQLSSASNDVIVRNVEVYDNGTANESSDGWHTDQEGVNLSGTNITFERVIVHDNGQDAFQSGGGVANFTLRDSWLYNARKKPDGSVWNYDRHPDGIQVWGGGEQYGVTIEGSIIGPGFMQGVLLGDAQAAVHNVTVRNSLFFGSGNSNLTTHPNQPVPSKKWLIENVTSDRPVGDSWTNLGFGWRGGLGAAAELTVRNSIFTGGYDLHIPTGGNYTGNVQFRAGTHSLGTEVDPRYANGAAYGSLAATADFALAADSPAAGKGTSVTSAAVLLAKGAVPTPPPAPSPTPTPTNSPTPTPIAVPGTLPGLSWEAEAGTITAPFTVSNGYVAQTTYTAEPAQGGKASYRFAVTTPGDYVVKAAVEAANTAANSLFVNVDGEPTSPTMIWDVPTGAGFQQRTVTWRGSGTPEANQYVPKVFSLTAGFHELIIRGREGNTKIDRIAVELLKPAEVPTPTPTALPTGTPAPTQPPSITIEAEAGAIAAPFTVGNGTVWQPVQTLDPAKGGRAAYKLNITTPGKYIVKAIVNAADLASNSLFVNFDGEPTSPTMIWDVPVTKGPAEVTVSWRGNGTESANQYAPKVFTLSAGQHELIIRGREKSLIFDRLTVQLVP